jgi:hypothetical protein
MQPFITMSSSSVIFFGHSLFPKSIMFEANALTKVSEVDEIVHLYSIAGYRVTHRDMQNVISGCCTTQSDVISSN